MGTALSRHETRMELLSQIRRSAWYDWNQIDPTGTMFVERYIPVLVACCLLPGCIFDSSGIRHSNQNINSNQNNSENCGDGALDAGEECDDSNQEAGDGCSPTCQEEAGWDCEGEPSVCSPETGCGNGELDAGEECDDGNSDDCDTCHNDCTTNLNTCGDGYTCGAEVCDDGDTQDCDPLVSGCRGDCMAITGCGDGILCGTEECDGVELSGLTCADYGYTTGQTLTCVASGQPNECTIDRSSCTCAGHGDCLADYQCIQGACVEMQGDDCNDSPLLLTGSTSFYDSTEQHTNSLNGGNSGFGCPGLWFDGADGGDKVYELNLSSGDWISVWTDSTFGAVLYILDGCNESGGDTCYLGRAGTNRLDWIAPAGGTYYLVVDGNDGVGEYWLDIRMGSAGNLRDADGSGGQGDLIFTEIMPDPAGHDYNCEWFEIYNPTTSALNLNGVTFGSPAGSFQLSADLIIDVGEYMVFAPYWGYATNCGLPWVAYQYNSSSFTLPGAADCTLTIDHNGTIDSLWYDATGGDKWPFSDGRSMYLTNNHQNPTDEDDVTYWCSTLDNAANLYRRFGSDNNYGTPGRANPADEPVSCP